MAKEKKPRRVTRVRTAFSRWFQWDIHVSNWKFIGEHTKRYFFVKKEEGSTTFQDAVKEYNLSEEDLNDRARSFYRLAIFNLFLFFLMLSYAIYMTVYFMFPGAFAAYAVSGLPLALAVRYHFWYFQVKERRLGCRLRDWFKKGILGRS